MTSRQPARGAGRDERPAGRREVRHRFTTMLGIAMCAVLARETSYAAIAEWAADLPPAVRLRLGIGRQPPPSESLIRRDLQHIDHDQLDRVVSGWLAGRARATAHLGRPRGSRCRRRAHRRRAPPRL